MKWTNWSMKLSPSYASISKAIVLCTILSSAGSQESLFQKNSDCFTYWHKSLGWRYSNIMMDTSRGRYTSKSNRLDCFSWRGEPLNTNRCLLVDRNKDLGRLPGVTERRMSEVAGVLLGVWYWVKAALEVCDSLSVTAPWRRSWRGVVARERAREPEEGGENITEAVHISSESLLLLANSLSSRQHVSCTCAV